MAQCYTHEAVAATVVAVFITAEAVEDLAAVGSMAVAMVVITVAVFQEFTQELADRLCDRAVWAHLDLECPILALDQQAHTAQPLIMPQLRIMAEEVAVVDITKAAADDMMDVVMAEDIGITVGIVAGGAVMA
jgi:hypothetical protein